MPVTFTVVENRIPLIRARVESTARYAVKKVADSIARTAQDNAPYVTGELHDSIHTTSILTGKEAEIIVEAYYGGYVEFGTRHMAAQSYLGPACEEHLSDLPEEIMLSFEI